MNYQTSCCNSVILVTLTRPGGNCLNIGPFAFLSHPSLRTTYDVHIGLIGKRVVDFLLVLIELFSLGVTAEALQAKIDRKSAISLQHGHFDPKFRWKGLPPPIIFARNG